ncbi:MAG: peptidoglycan-associated lipoprotein Pal [Gammaproteobacteria bacterium]|nr:peptidoglycan-associated lipoprotein Pal [Gammaproteobacteria bacterium]
MNRFKMVLPVLAMVFAVGCSSVDSTSGAGDSVAGDNTSVTAIPDDSGAAVFGISSVAVAADGGPIGETGMLLDSRTIYFALDSAQVTSESLSILQEHGEFLGLHPQSKLRIEGHADERGSREYNLGLGERRAQAVRSILLVQGASADQLTTVSYGEERPAVFGSDEAAWAQNRRVELAYGK